MGFENLSEEIKKKLNACETPDDLLQAAADHGVKFSDDEMAMISGGADSFRSYKDTLKGMLASPDNMLHLLSPEDNAGIFLNPDDKAGIVMNPDDNTGIFLTPDDNTGIFASS